MKSTSALVAVVLAFAFAQPASAQTYYEDVRPVLDQNCMTCHTEAGVAFSMEDAERTYRRRRAIGTTVADRLMPPWLAEPGHQQYVGDRSLSAADIKTITDWALADYPKGDPASYEVTEQAAAATEGSFQPDVTLELIPGQSYLPAQDRDDDYRCFVTRWPETGPTYITGFRGAPGNLNVAHHIVLYAAGPEYADRFAELEDVEDGAGYTCFNGALPDELFDPERRAAYEEQYPNGLREISRANRWLAHWAPGMDGYAFPEGTGLPIESGSVVIVQLHYYSAHAPGESDSGTRMEFVTRPDVDRAAYNFPFTDNDWFQGREEGTMVVPPGENATYSLTASLDNLLPEIAHALDVDADSIQDLTIHSANLHMHKFGASGTISLTRSDGAEEMLLSVPVWDLGWQRDFEFVDPKHFTREDFANTRLTVTCTYHNPTENPVYGGLGSEDEMCFNLPYLSVGVRPSVAAAEAGPPPFEAAAISTRR